MIRHRNAENVRQTANGLTRRTLLRSSAAAAGGLVLPPWMRSASAATSAEAIAAASGAAKVLVWEGYENAEAFSGLPDVQIEAAYLAANEDTISKTGTPGSFDALTIYQGMIDPLLHLGRVQPIDTDLLPNRDKLFSFFRELGGLSRDGKTYGIPYTWGTLMVLYDADQIDEPQSFDDLMAPALKGKVAMPDDAYAVITTFARYAGFEDANRLSPDQLETVMNLLDKFRPQILSIAPSYGELPAMFARGEIAVSLPDWTPSVLAAVEAGRNVKSVIPAEGGFSFVDSWMLVNGALNEAAAYAVMNEAIGTHAQSVMAEYTGLGIVNAEAAAGLPEDIAKLWGYDDLQSNFSRAPLFPGAPISNSDGVTTYQDWLQAWTRFKAS
ncbi:extracellular solute-binding protein [Mameliella alba]|uniref:ABC transporter substrate-binding protein n=1 Tax=Mameliella alba TaxID=561184 RepID=UPI001C953FDA|nr:extracellular solute-binding protein [Mameliella alba]MBY6120392.1 extracellular solute-binding protein [Mameliella alba]